MTIKISIIISFILVSIFAKSQTVSGIYKIDNLLNRLKNKDTTYIVNFWATWCKPCVQELPAFDSLFVLTKKTNTKIILVSLDFIEDIETKVKPFLAKNNIKCQVLILDEINGNDYINKISQKWSGAIPATLFKNEQNINFVESKINFNELQKYVEDIKRK